MRARDTRSRGFEAVESFALLCRIPRPLTHTYGVRENRSCPEKAPNMLNQA